MKILGIETSCDETAASLIEVASGRENGPETVRILGNAVHSQIDVHASYGGVFPTLAKREHQRNLVPVLEKTLGEAGMLEKAAPAAAAGAAGSLAAIEAILSREPELLEALKASIPSLKKPDIDYISITVGPGLEPALWVGINFARALSTLWNIPLIPANHMEGHILASLIRKDADGRTYRLLEKEVVYPALSVLISGGHTQIILMDKIGSYRIVGETLDDAVGECFDKTARTLGLAYPGGPKISKLAAEARAKGVRSPEPLPRPMISSGELNFSFSGLKTAVLYLVKRLREKNIAIEGDVLEGIAREIEDSITETIVAKTKKAIETYGAGTLIIGGGVIANTHIREALEKLALDCSLSLLLPETGHSTDNALMMALAGYFSRDKAVDASAPLKADGTLSLGPRG